VAPSRSAPSSPQSATFMLAFDVFHSPDGEQEAIAFNVS
jgi:hypothetical protein